MVQRHFVMLLIATVGVGAVFFIQAAGWWVIPVAYVVLGVLVTKLSPMSPPGYQVTRPGCASVIWPILLTKMIIDAQKRKRSKQRYIAWDEQDEMHYFPDLGDALSLARKVAEIKGRMQVFQDTGIFVKETLGRGWTHRFHHVYPRNHNEAEPL